MHARLRIAVPLLVLGVAGCSSAAGSTRSAASSTAGPATSDQAAGTASPLVLRLDAYGPLTPLGRRTAGPVVLRSFRGPGPEVSACDRFSRSCAPAWCAVTGSLVTELSTDAIATSRSSGIIGLAPGSDLSVLGPGAGPDEVIGAGANGGSTVGTAEGAPVQLQTVRVSPEVATVRLTTPDGEDSAAPSDGLATLGVPGAATSGRLVASDAAGRQLAAVDLPATPTISSSACRPVPPQPPQPGEQPKDAAAAEQQVRQAFQTAFSHAPASDRYRALTAVENGAPLRVSLDQLRQSFPQVAETVTVSTGRLVFTDPRTAAVQYTLSYSGGAPYDTTYGRALLVDGHWLVSRETFCGALGYAGITCPD